MLSRPMMFVPMHLLHPFNDFPVLDIALLLIYLIYKLGNLDDLFERIVVLFSGTLSFILDSP